MKIFYNRWHKVEDSLPKTGVPVLCYWKEYKDDVFMICNLVHRSDNKIMFEGWDVRVSHQEVTHWRKLPNVPK
jgi:hypothetical protein